MKRLATFAIVLLVSVTTWQIASDDSLAIAPIGGSPTSTTSSMPIDLIKEQVGSMPLAFTENHGQWDERVRFCARARVATTWFTPDGIYHQFTHWSEAAEDMASAPTAYDRSAQQPNEIELLMIKASFVGANPNPEITGKDMMQYKCNYFIGNDAAKWHTNVPNYSSIVMSEVYPGIDLRFYGDGRQMEYDFVVSPGADVSQIEIQYDHVRSLSVNEAGELMIETDWGPMTELRPKVYQSDGDALRPIAGEFRLVSENSFGFAVTDRYNRSKPIIIDPMISFAYGFGGENADFGEGIVVEGNRYAYIAGYTSSSDFPTVNPLQPTFGGASDAFVTKLDMATSSLVYSTFLGGSGTDHAYATGLRNDGTVCVTGYTASVNFPTHLALQDTSGGNFDAFVTKLSAAGDALIYSTYLGGPYRDQALDLAVDFEGYAYITGLTGESGFPVQNPLQPECAGYQDIFIAKIWPNGGSLVYSTYLGGTLGERSECIAADSEGNAYVTGMTQSEDFPTESPAQASLAGGSDVFVCKINPTGQAFVYSTFHGGSAVDLGYGITIDDAGAAYVTGYTYSFDFPAINPVQATHGGGQEDCFAFKLSPDGSTVEYSTYLGGSGKDLAYKIAVNAVGCAYVAGSTRSEDFPTHNALQETLIGPMDALLFKLNPAGDDLVYSTYLKDIGCGYLSRGAAVAVQDNGTAVVTGGGILVVAVSAYELCGDTDDNAAVDIDDVVYLVNYIFAGGPPPDPVEDGDVNCSGSVDIDDVVFLVNFIFSGGYGPCDTDGDGIPDC